MKNQKIVPNIISNETLQKTAKVCKVGKFSLPIHQSNQQISQKEQVFFVCKGALYVNLGENNHRVVDLCVGQPEFDKVSNKLSRRVSFKFLKNSFNDDVEGGEFARCSAGHVAGFAKNIIKNKLAVNLSVNPLGQVHAPLCQNFAIPSINRKTHIFPQQPQNSDKPANKGPSIWNDLIKPLTNPAFKILGIVLIISVLFGLAPMALVPFALWGGILCFCYPAEIVEKAEKLIKSLPKKLKKAYNAVQYEKAMTKFLATKDYWAKNNVELCKSKWATKTSRRKFVKEQKQKEEDEFYKNLVQNGFFQTVVKPKCSKAKQIAKNATKLKKFVHHHKENAMEM